MADEGQWVTINGQHILIKDGESPMSAFIRRLGKTKNKNKAKMIENIQKYSKNYKPPTKEERTRARNTTNLYALGKKEIVDQIKERDFEDFRKRNNISKEVWEKDKGPSIFKQRLEKDALEKRNPFEVSDSDNFDEKFVDITKLPRDEALQAFRDYFDDREGKFDLKDKKPGEDAFIDFDKLKEEELKKKKKGGKK